MTICLPWVCVTVAWARTEGASREACARLDKHASGAWSSDWFSEIGLCEHAQKLERCRISNAFRLVSSRGFLRRFRKECLTVLFDKAVIYISHKVCDLSARELSVGWDRNFECRSSEDDNFFDFCERSTEKARLPEPKSLSQILFPSNDIDCNASSTWTSCIVSIPKGGAVTEHQCTTVSCSTSDCGFRDHSYFPALCESHFQW